MPTWPSSVPFTCDINSLKEADLDVTARFKPDWGIEKLRPRSSSYIQTLSYTKVLTLAQWDNLLTFYRFDCKNGTQTFTSTHPRKGTAMTAQFSGIPEMQTLDSALVVRAAISLTLLPQVPDPSWTPTIGGVQPIWFADFTTEGGADPHYLYRGSASASFSAWLAQLGLTFSRALAAYRTNSIGLLESIGSGVPRFDYDPVTLLPLGLLTEGSSQNTQLQSSAYGNAAWTLNGVTRTSGQSDPFGGTAAFLLTGSSGAFELNNTGNSSVSTGDNTVSWLIKPGTETAVLLSSSNIPGIFACSVTYNPATLAFSSPSSVTNTEARVISSNGWQLVQYTFTSTGNQTNITNKIAVSGAGKTVSVAGTQMEAQGRATSYIQTTTVAVTRPADATTAASIAAWYNSAASTFYGQADHGIISAGRILNINDGTQNNDIELCAPTTAGQLARIGSGGSTVFNAQTSDSGQSVYSLRVSAKAAVSAMANNFNYDKNGGTVDTDLSGAMPVSPTALEIGQLLNGSNLYGHIAQLGYWQVAATAAQLQALTT